jgi:hypothetical protein
VENEQVVSKHVGVRFPSAPLPAKEIAVKSSTLEKNVEINQDLFKIKTSKILTK